MIDFSRRHGRAVCGLAILLGLVSATGRAADFPVVTGVERQPLAAATERLVEALQYVGVPLNASQTAALQAASQEADPDKYAKALQKVLDPLCLAAVTINPESRVSVVEGAVKKELFQHGWQTFLIKVDNQAGINPELKIESQNFAPIHKRSTGSPEPKPLIAMSDVANRFMDAAMYNSQPLKPALSGLALEYRIVQLYSRDAGKREATLGFNVGQGTQDLGFRNALPVLFTCLPAVEVTLGVKDFDGQPTTASFLIHDKYQRVYPNPARRLAPDFFFHHQIYRADGEKVLLPPGEYMVTVTRGPEYRAETHPLKVEAGRSDQRDDVQLTRWIHPATRQWYSGDHHVHAAGCAHYESPTEGVTPADMMRHILGEDLNVGCVLTWGPCWYSQKQYFEGKNSALSRPDYLMRYDIEVSGFPSSHAGHLCLLRLKEDDYEGTTRLEQWPTWTMPILAWGKKQGGVVGYSHSGWGISLPDYDPAGNRVPIMKGRAADKLPDYAMPPFDGIGANEYIVTAAHDVCDFISAVDTPIVYELNIWYHTLNVGLRTRISGETDFPCIYGDRVGLGRIYVKVDKDQPLTFDNWTEGLKNGRSYCCDGLSHIMDFRVNNLGLGEPGTGGKISQLGLPKPGKVTVELDVSALLAAEPTAETEAIRTRRLDQKPYWHIERARVGKGRTVPVELIVNGRPVASREIVADGSVQKVRFETDIGTSSWIAARIFPAVHTNPVFVEVAGKPIRASRKSADWCAKAVDVCWKAKSGRIRKEEQEAAKLAYDQARKIYEALLQECTAD